MTDSYKVIFADVLCAQGIHNETTLPCLVGFFTISVTQYAATMAP